tara:strand:+ start:2829 stop:3017 length:189 start_codon:yes stop_codon:yes gene_type:complete
MKTIKFENEEYTIKDIKRLDPTRKWGEKELRELSQEDRTQLFENSYAIGQWGIVVRKEGWGK